MFGSCWFEGSSKLASIQEQFSILATSSETSIEVGYNKQKEI